MKEKIQQMLLELNPNCEFDLNWQSAEFPLNKLVDNILFLMEEACELQKEECSKSDKFWLQKFISTVEARQEILKTKNIAE